MNHLGFSIVIANYNSGKYLEDAILSVTKQRYPKVQLIVIDGASTDNSVEVIKRHEKDIDYWISEKDNGQSDAFNKGFMKARYDWLFWLNADDFLLKDSLFKLDNGMRKLLAKRPVGGGMWFTFDNVLVKEDGTTSRTLYGPAWNSFFNAKLGPQIHSATSVFHKSLFERSLRFDESLYWSMDLDLWYQFFKLGERYEIVHSFIYGFRINPQSKTISNGVDSNTKRSEERQRQSAYMVRKNNMNIQYKWINWWRLYKMFNVYPMNAFYTLLYRGKQWKWW